MTRLRAPATNPALVYQVVLAISRQASDVELFVLSTEPDDNYHPDYNFCINLIVWVTARKNPLISMFALDLGFIQAFLECEPQLSRSWGSGPRLCWVVEQKPGIQYWLRLSHLAWKGDFLGTFIVLTTHFPCEPSQKYVWEISWPADF